MEHYRLAEDEVVLYKGNISFLTNLEKAQLILTNINMVFITHCPECANEEVAAIEFYPISDIKIYQGRPQIKINGYSVEIFLKSTEKEFLFDSKHELHKFVDEAMALLTGKTKVERGAEKVKKSIDLIDDTLGIDTINTAISTMKNLGNITGGIGKLTKNLLKHKK